MASTVRKLPRRVIALSALALAGSHGAAGATHLTTPHGPISVDASSTRIDYKTQHVQLRNVIISRGELKVTAERAEATGLNFKDSLWSFTGNVHISSPEHGTLTSDTATVRFRDERMQTAVATGKPARFRQTASKSGVLAHGHADSIVYTVDADTVQLKGDAWLEYGSNKISAPLLVYDIASQKLEGASAEPSGRVHITVRPKKDRAGRGASPERSP